MLARSPVLRRGAKLILAASAIAMFVAAGSVLAEAIQALVSSTLFGF